MGLQLSGSHKRELRDALESAFPSEIALRRMVSEELDVNLGSIVAGASLSDMAFALIEWAESKGSLEQLVKGAQNSNATNPKLRTFGAWWRDSPRDQTGVSPPATRFVKWRPLLADIGRGECTPILGPELLKPLLGLPQDLARHWAERHSIPLAGQAREDLPQVAQFLATTQRNPLGVEFDKYLTETLLRNHAALISPEAAEAPPDELLRLVARARWPQEPDNPYRVLAALPCPLYITANPDCLLLAALEDAGKAPQEEVCRWRDDDRWPLSVSARVPGYTPSKERPLVYHLFGRLPYPFSLVLKEDDYFDYLVGVTRYRRLVPDAVQFKLADSGLLFLGFRVDDWSFRVLFHSLISDATAGRRARHAHVAVQLDPQRSSAAEAERMRYYLESYFGAADVTIYWGPVAQFLSELHAKWTASQAAPEAT